MRGHRCHPTGFTLVELLVVIAIIAVLAAILFPVFAKAREKAFLTTCLSNNRQLAVDITMYLQDHDETFFGDTVGSPWTTAMGAAITSVLCNCPAKNDKGCASQPDYGFNAALFGTALGINTTPSTTPLIGDLVISLYPPNPNYTLLAPGDLDYRHLGSCVVSYLDGHAVSTNSNFLPTGSFQMKNITSWTYLNQSYVTKYQFGSLPTRTSKLVTLSQPGGVNTDVSATCVDITTGCLFTDAIVFQAATNITVWNGANTYRPIIMYSGAFGSGGVALNTGVNMSSSDCITVLLNYPAMTLVGAVNKAASSFDFWNYTWVKSWVSVNNTSAFPF